MNRSIIIMVLCAGFITSLSAAEVPTENLPGLTSPNGLALGLVNGFESWLLVSGHARIDKNEFHYIWGNGEAMRAIKAAGTGEPVFGKGSIFVKAGYRMRRNPLFPDSIEPSGLQRVEFMVKDPGRFPDTGGWGYARFPYDPARGSFSVYGTAKDFAQECYGCHLRARSGDFVFTKHMNYFAGPNPDAVSLSSSPVAGFPRWLWHPVANTIAFILLVCGALVAHYLKRTRWWTAAHVSLQAAGIAVLAAGIAAMVSVIGQGHHLNMPHAYFGLVTAAAIFLSALGGTVALSVRSITKAVRPIHRWAGRISIILMLVTIITGIIMSVAGH
jgi:hypothetical protein